MSEAWQVYPGSKMLHLSPVLIWSVVLVIQHAKRMRLVMLSVASVTLHYFPHYLINCVFFGRKDFNKKLCFYFLCSFSLKDFSFEEEFIGVLS